MQPFCLSGTVKKHTQVALFDVLRNRQWLWRGASRRIVFLGLGVETCWPVVLSFCTASLLACEDAAKSSRTSSQRLEFVMCPFIVSEKRRKEGFVTGKSFA